MQDNPSDWTPTVLAILSWIIIPTLTHYINTNRDKRNEYNQIIDNIEQLFKEMNKVAFKYLEATDFEIENYYQLIAFNNQLKLLRSRLLLIDNKYQISPEHLKNIRKITTDDTGRNTSSFRSLLAIQSEIINLLPKNYRIWFR
ncbi:hypothetical protein [Shewanella putrefaciens]